MSEKILKEGDDLFKFLKIVAVGVSVLVALPVYADELSDLKAQGKVLKAEETLGIQPIPVVEAPQKEAAPAPRILPRGAFIIPGTDTSVKFGGFIQTTVSADIKSTFGGPEYDQFAPFSAANGGIPYDNSLQANRGSGQIQFEARTTRLNLDFNTPTPYGNLRTFFESDFLGTGGSKLQSNSTAPRLRHAYAELGPLLVGQYWTNKGDIAQGINLFDVIGGPVGLSMGRFPQARYTYKINPTSLVALSIEQPVQDFSGANAVAFGAPGTNTSTNSVDTMPDVALRYTLGESWGRQSLSLAVRRIKVEGTNTLSLVDPAHPDLKTSTALGYFVNYQGQINLFGTDKFLYDLILEDGDGRDMTTVQTSAIITANGDLSTVKGQAATVAYQHYWAPKFSSNIAYGHAHYSSNDWTKVASDRYARFNTANSLHANFMWSPIKDSYIGIEYVYGKIGNDIGDNGAAQRITVGARFPLFN